MDNIKKLRQLPCDLETTTILKTKIIKEKILVEKFPSIEEWRDFRILKLKYGILIS